LRKKRWKAIHRESRVKNGRREKGLVRSSGRQEFKEGRATMDSGKNLQQLEARRGLNDRENPTEKQRRKRTP